MWLCYYSSDSFVCVVLPWLWLRQANKKWRFYNGTSPGNNRTGNLAVTELTFTAWANMETDGNCVIFAAAVMS